VEGHLLADVRRLVTPLVPWRLRRLLRSLVEPEIADPRDVERVKAVTAGQWQTAAARSPRYVASYWDHAEDVSRPTRGRRRSEWLAARPPFAEVGSVLELGCAAGRNLYVLQQRYPALALSGVDINAEAVAHAAARVRGEFTVGDLYDLPAVLGDRVVDLIFTMGVLIHLHPDTLPGVVEEMRRHARRYLVFVEQASGDQEVVKGPARWKPSRKVTGAYIQWSPDLPGLLTRLGIDYQLSGLPADVQSNGARQLIVATL
jgi:SAM-dependent methyltransferase